MLKYLVKAQTRVMELEDRPRDEEGAGLVEYGLLVALIAMACVAAIRGLGGKISALFNGIDFT